MRKTVLVLLALLLILTLCACGNFTGLIKPGGGQSSAKPSPSHASTPASPSAASTPSQTPSHTPKPSATPPQASTSASPKPSSPFGGNLKPTPAPSAQPSAAPSPSPSASGEKTPLSAESLAYWTDYFAQQENNGFLLSSYDRPEDVDLEQLFYAGAGIASWDATQAEIDAYLDYYGEEELWGGLMKLTPEQVDDFLIEKTGVSLWDTTGYWTWTYLEQFDAWYAERSDTNYGFFECVSGYKTADGTVVIQCQVPDGYGQQVDKCTVTLRKAGDRFLFVSNKAHMTY